MNLEDLKRDAGEEAAQQVESGMRLGLGTGSTVRYFLEALGRRLARNELNDVVGVPTSLATERLAKTLSIPLTTLSSMPELDLCVDGADEVDPQLNLIKGMGGALLREKIVAAVSSRLIIIADQTKVVDSLGQKSPLPVEVLPFGWKPTAAMVRTLGATLELRKQGREVVMTDQSNFILDCRFPDLGRDPHHVARSLEALPGVLGHGLFLGMASEAIIAAEGGVQRMTVTG